VQSPVVESKRVRVPVNNNRVTSKKNLSIEKKTYIARAASQRQRDLNPFLVRALDIDRFLLLIMLLIIRIRRVWGNYRVRVSSELHFNFGSDVGFDPKPDLSHASEVQECVVVAMVIEVAAAKPIFWRTTS